MEKRYPTRNKEASRAPCWAGLRLGKPHPAAYAARLAQRFGFAVGQMLHCQLMLDGLDGIDSRGVHSARSRDLHGIFASLVCSR